MKIFESAGDEILSYWNNGDGYIGFQTTYPSVAEALRHRSGMKLLGIGVTKGYLRVFEEKLSVPKAKALVKKALLKNVKDVQKGEK